MSTAILVGGFHEDEDLHSYINALSLSFGTYLYGRRMYETMVYWEIAHTLDHAWEMEDKDLTDKRV